MSSTLKIGLAGIVVAVVLPLFFLDSSTQAHGPPTDSLAGRSTPMRATYWSPPSVYTNGVLPQPKGTNPLGAACSSDADCDSLFCFRSICRADQPPQSVRQNVIVVDNFYTDAMEVRNYVLNNLDFTVRGNYPGIRTIPMVTQSTKDMLQKMLGRNFTYFPTDHYNGAFQYTLASHISWIHADATQWAGVIFLTPNAPLNSGTRYYRHKATRLTERPTLEDAVRLGFANVSEAEKFVNRDSQNYEAWELVDEVGNMFNRLALFRGFRYHQSAEYFGTDKHNARLFQTFFFDC